MIIVTDQYHKPKTILSNHVPKAPDYFEDGHREQLDGLLTYEFSTLATHPSTVHLKQGNNLIVRDLDNRLQLFTIIRSVEQQQGGKYVRRVFAENAAVDDLYNNIVSGVNLKAISAKDAATRVLEGTGWKLGLIDYMGLKNIDLSEHPTALAALHKIRETFGLEMSFTVNFNGMKVVDRFVHMVKKRGKVTKKRFEYTKDLTEISRTEDRSDLATAIIPVGKADENGKRLTMIAFENIHDGYVSPKGQDWVGDDNALQQFGKGGKHLFARLDLSNVDNEYELMELAVAELKRRMKPRLTYEVGVILLERLTGHEHEKVRLGDTVHVLDKTFEPAIAVEARVLEIYRSYTDPKKDKVLLGEFVPLVIDKNKQIEAIQNIINQNMSKWEKEGEIVVKSVNEPPLKDRTPDMLWLDLSSTPNIMKRWDAESKKWVKASHTTAEEVGAETPDGAQDKANKAEDNAIAEAAEDAAIKAQKAEDNAVEKAEEMDEEVKIELKSYVEGLTEEVEAATKEHAEKVAADAELNAKIFTEGYAEREFHYGDEPPEDTSQLWFDLGSDPNKIRRYDEETKTWVAASPTSPSDIGAASIQETIDEANRAREEAIKKAQEEASQAKKDAVQEAKELDKEIKSEAERLAKAAEEAANSHTNDVTQQVEEALKQDSQNKADAAKDGAISEADKRIQAAKKESAQDAQNKANAAQKAAEAAAKKHTDELTAQAEKNAKQHADDRAKAAAEASKTFTQSYAQKEIKQQNTAPTDTSLLWLDTSKDPNILKRYDATSKKWINASPTSASQIGAETPAEAQKKADAAEKKAREAAIASVKESMQSPSGVNLVVNGAVENNWISWSASNVPNKWYRDKGFALAGFNWAMRTDNPTASTEDNWIINILPAATAKSSIGKKLQVGGWIWTSTLTVGASFYIRVKGLDANGNEVLKYANTSPNYKGQGWQWVTFEYNDWAAFKSVDEIRLSSNVKKGNVGTCFVTGFTIKTGDMPPQFSPSPADYEELASDASFLTKGTLAVERLYGITIDANKVNVVNLDANNITAGTLDAGKVNVKNLKADSIVSGTLDAGKVTVKNLSASVLQAGILDASKVTVNNLDASKITTGTMSADKIKGGSIDANNVNIVNLKAGNITTGTLDASKVAVTNLNANNITTGTLNAARIAANAITTDKLHVLAKSLVANTSITGNDSTGWNISKHATSTIGLRGSANMGDVLVHGFTAADHDTPTQHNSQYFEVDPNQTYKFSIGMFLDKNNRNASQYFGLNAYDKNMKELPMQPLNPTNGALSGDPRTNPYFWSGKETSGSWRFMEGYAVSSQSDGNEAPQGRNIQSSYRMHPATKYLRMRFYSGYYPTVKNVAMEVLWHSPSVSKVDSGTIIADRIVAGTIDASKVNVTKINASNITTGGMSADRIAAGTIDARKITVIGLNASNIVSGTIDAAKIGVTNLKAENITSGTLNAARIGAGAISADKLATNSVTAVKILAGNITAEKIATNAVTADKIITNAVTADKIAANAVTAAKIAAGNITAEKIAAGSITTDKIAAAGITADKITSGVLDANRVQVKNLNASVITAGTMSADRITGGTINATNTNIINLKAQNIASGTINADNVTISNGRVTIGKAGVQVTDADFLVKDAKTGFTHTLQSQTNLIADHSFEMLTATGNISEQIYRPIDPSYINKNAIDGWMTVGTPMIVDGYTTDTPDDSAAFGRKAIRCNTNNYVWTDFPVKANSQYTISFHTSKPYYLATTAAPQVQVEYVKNGSVISSEVKNFAQPTSPVGQFVRYGFTVTTPATLNDPRDNRIRLRFRANNYDFIMYDGIQAVQGAKAVPYDSEDSLFLMSNNRLTPVKMHLRNLMMQGNTRIENGGLSIAGQNINGVGLEMSEILRVWNKPIEARNTHVSAHGYQCIAARPAGVDRMIWVGWHDDAGNAIYVYIGGSWKVAVRL